MATVTPDLLLRLGWIDPEAWTPPIAAACKRRDITTAQRVAMFLANAGHETNGGRRLVESLDYTPQALVATWPRHFTADYAAEVGRTSSHPADQQAIAEAAYGGRMGNTSPGDGWLYRGRGLMQTTGRDGYAKLALATGRKIDAIPAWLETREGAAESAAAYWAWAGCNPLADAGAIEACRKAVNGGLIGLDDVRARWLRALTALGVHA